MLSILYQGFKELISCFQSRCVEKAVYRQSIRLKSLSVCLRTTDNGKLASRNYGVSENRNHGIMESWNHGIMESRIIGTV